MEYFYDVKDCENKPVIKDGTFESIKEYLESAYNYADNLRSQQCVDGVDAKFKELFNDVKKNRVIYEKNPEYRDKLRNLELLTLGNICLRQGQYLNERFKDSKECYRNAVEYLWQIGNYKEYNCDSLLVKMNLGKYFRNRGKIERHNYYDSAENEFIDIVEIIEKNTANCGMMEAWELHLWLEAKINIGRGKKSSYKLDEAEKSFWEIAKNICDRLPDFENELYNKRSILKNLNSKAGLRKAYDEAPNNSIYNRVPDIDSNQRIYAIYKEYLLQSFLQLAIIYRKKHLYDQAEALCEIILNYMDKENIDAQNEKGACLRKRGETPRAVEFFEKNEKLNNRFARLNYLKCKLKLGDLDINKDFQMMNSDDLEVVLIKGGYYRRKKQWEEAYSEYEKICSETPYIRQGTTALKAYYNMARCKLEMGDIYRAQQMLEKIDADCKNKDVPTRIELGRCHMKLGNYQEVLNIYDSLINNMSEEDGFTKIDKIWIISSDRKTEIYFNCGICHFKLGDKKKANAMFGKVLELNKKHLEAQFFQAECQIYDQEEQKKEAEDENESAAKKTSYEHAMLKMSEIVGYDTRNSNFISELAIMRKKYLKLDALDADQVRGQMKDCLKYIPGPYSLNACISFADFIEWQEKSMNQREQDELFRAFSRIMLDEKEEGYSAFSEFKKTPAFQRLDAIHRGKVLVKLYKIYENVVAIKNACRVPTSNSKMLVHYTSIDTLKKLLKRNEKENKNENKPRMRLWNSVYMNDPFEGEKFIDLIKKAALEKTKETHENQDVQNNQNKTSTADDILKKYFPHLLNKGEQKEKEYPDLFPVNSNVYFTSFSSEMDNIQMWVQYADGAKGCNIAFDEGFFVPRHDCDALDKTSVYADRSFPLYRIQYIDKDDMSSKDLNSIQKNITNIWNYLEILDKDILDEISKDDLEKVDVIRNFVTNCLNEVRFLFKDKEYKHEDEYRLVLYSHRPKIDEEHFPIPRLYIEVDQEIQIEQVMLGPKISQEETNEIVSWLHAVKCVKKVTQSVRHYK